MNILKRLDNHPNLVKLLDIVVEKDANLTTSTYFVFEYCEHDLEGMLMSNIRFNLSQIKRIIHSILSGLSDLHKKNIIHRDIKTDNILYNKNKEIKVADFGLSKDLNIKRAPLSRKLQHMFYRAPESLFGSQHYSFKVDIWCVGIIFYQLLFRNQEQSTYKILFPANNDEQLRQAKNYFNILGNPEIESIWPTQSKNELKMKEYETVMSQFTPEEKANFKNRFVEYLKEMNPTVDDSALVLLSKMIVLDPAQRFSADECLQHPFFQQEPVMADLSEMPLMDDGQEYHQMSSRRQLQEQQAATLTNIPQQGQVIPIAGDVNAVHGNIQMQQRKNRPQNLQRNNQKQMIMNGQGLKMQPPQNGQVPMPQGASPQPNQVYNSMNMNRQGPNTQQGKPNLQQSCIQRMMICKKT